MFLVGLTGGIGSGKSTVAQLFCARGAQIVDTDLIAHRLTAAQGEAIGPIRQVFGDSVLTAEGALDRDQMRQRVFQDATARRQLEALLHPLIGAQARREILTSSAPYAIVVVPLLIERGGWKEQIDRIAVVDCPEEQQIERVMMRSALSREQVLAIMTTQASRAERLAAADDVIDNSGGEAALPQQVEFLHQCYLAYAANLRTLG